MWRTTQVVSETLSDVTIFVFIYLFIHPRREDYRDTDRDQYREAVTMHDFNLP